MITANYDDRQTPQFRVLSDSQCQELYLAALECLDRIGVVVNHEEARDLLAAAGARVEGNRAYIPANIVQDALAAAPRTFTIQGRSDRHRIQVKPDRVHFGPGPTCTYFLDPHSGERRKARRGDAGLVAKVCDALDNIDYVMSLSLFDDVTPLLSPVYEFAEMIANTGKPVLAWANNAETLRLIYQIAASVAGGETAFQRRPNFAFFATYESPLRNAENSLGSILWAAEHGIPIIYLGGPTVGVESPVTAASGLALHLASALSGLSIIQLKRRGAPVVIGSVPAAMDLRTARPAYGSPELSLNSAAATDLARFLGLPFMGTAGASESKLLDTQAAVEITFQILASALSGAALVHDVGFLDCADIGSLELLVLADEIIDMTARFMRGVEVNKDTIMLDLIEKVGPEGHFLGEPRSVALCRQEIWIPQLLDRNAYVIWQQKGASSMEQRVSRKLHEILETHQPAPLSPDVLAQVQQILKDGESAGG